MRTLILTVVLLSLIPFSLYASARSNSGGLANRVAELEAQVEQLSAILEFVYVETKSINGLLGPHLIIEGANVHVRSGSGSTADGCPFGDPNCGKLTGLGNFIVGYNEPLPPRHPGDPPHEDRTGSHNLVVGEWHSYASFAGFVAGRRNRLMGPHASVSGGFTNHASGPFSSICGGELNVASGTSSSVGGGFVNWARGDFSSVSGGGANTASGDRSSISGGSRSEASGPDSSVSGGEGNGARGAISSVSGGRGNSASGFASSVSGGRIRTAPENFNWAAGNLLEKN